MHQRYNCNKYEKWPVLHARDCPTIMCMEHFISLQLLTAYILLLNLVCKASLRVSEAVLVR
jgi:hypothetical protein